MRSIEWDAALETGDPLVDEQHRAIHALFNDLASAEDRPQEIMHVLDALLEHAAMHFDTEEDLMRREEYPAALFEEHVAEHRDLTGTARRHVMDFRAGRLVHTAQLAAALQEWILGHVQRHDRALVEYVRSRGGKACLPDNWASPPQS